MPKYKIRQKCYYAEVGGKPRLYYPDEIYSSATLKPEDAPKYFQLVGANAPAEPAAPAPEPLGGTDGLPAPVEMSYQEMKTFVIDNNIAVADNKKDTLIAAIKAFKEVPAEPAAAEGEELTDEDDGSEGTKVEVPAE